MAWNTFRRLQSRKRLRKGENGAEHDDSEVEEVIINEEDLFDLAEAKKRKGEPDLMYVQPQRMKEIPISQIQVQNSTGSDSEKSFIISTEANQSTLDEFHDHLQ